MLLMRSDIVVCCYYCLAFSSSLSLRPFLPTHTLSLSCAFLSLLLIPNPSAGRNSSLDVVDTIDVLKVERSLSISRIVAKLSVRRTSVAAAVSGDTVLFAGGRYALQRARKGELTDA